VRLCEGGCGCRWLKSCGFMIFPRVKALGWGLCGVLENQVV
jgi:hypothetical protein